jgi:hypothetical protein
VGEGVTGDNVGARVTSSMMRPVESVTFPKDADVDLFWLCLVIPTASPIAMATAQRVTTPILMNFVWTMVAEEIDGSVIGARAMTIAWRNMRYNEL